MAQTFEQYLLAEYDAGTLADIAKHGCQTGFPGLTYYHETTDLYEKFEDEIWDKVYEYAQENGENVLAFLGGLNGAENVGSDAQFKNLMVWFTVEQFSYEFDNKLEQRELKENSKGYLVDVEDDDRIMHFVTVWDGGEEVRTLCGYDTSGDPHGMDFPVVYDIDTQDDVEDLEILERSYIESPQGEEIRNFYDADNKLYYVDGQAQDEDSTRDDLDAAFKAAYPPTLA